MGFERRLVMKRFFLIGSFFVAVFMLLVAGTLDSVYAQRGGGGHGGGGGGHGGGRGGGGTSVPEPATLALLGAGIASVAGYLYIKQKNKK